MLDNVDAISGKKRKENLTNHADDARISKQLATMQDEIETRARPRRADGRWTSTAAGLRDVAAEFELRVVIQRLEDELPGSVPGRRRRRRDRDQGRRRGRSPTSPTGPIAVAARDGRWGATDGKSVLEGEASEPADLAESFAGAR